jgi:hypothetical protein
MWSQYWRSWRVPSFPAIDKYNIVYYIACGKWGTEVEYNISDSCWNGLTFKHTGKRSFINIWYKFKLMLPSTVGWMKFMSFIQYGTQVKAGTWAVTKWLRTYTVVFLSTFYILSDKT